MKIKLRHSAETQQGRLASALEKAFETVRLWFSTISPARVLLFIGSLFLSIALAELGLRLFIVDEFSPMQQERSLLYEYHPVLGWFPKKNTSRRFTASRTTTVTHNSQGFRSPEPETNNKPGIIFLGDSFVWGFDVEAPERFTDKLQARHPEWNISNLGVSGYGTDQELLLLESHFDVYKPRAVILVFCTDNDIEDNATNVRQGGFYKPYCTGFDSNGIIIKGIPVPRCYRAMLADHMELSHLFLTRFMVRAYCKFHNPPTFHANRNPTDLLLLAMRSYVVKKGAFFGVAMQENNEDFKKLLTEYQIPWVALRTKKKFPGFAGHWTPEGHTEVCDDVDKFLMKAAENSLLMQNPKP